MSEARATEADRLLAEPVTIEHPAGREVDLVFTNRVVVEIERQFGSMGDFEDALRESLRKQKGAPILTTVVKSLDALLWDDPPAIRENRADCVELTKLMSYIVAIVEAWSRLWPPPEPAKPEPAKPEPAKEDAKEDADPNSDGARSAESPGEPGTTSQPPAGIAPMTSSGTA